MLVAAFTRTLTVVYSITLLSLFTHIQLSILGRSKYIQSLIQQERDERIREQLQYSTSVYALFWGDSSLEDPDTDELEESDTVSEETERKFLTLSWWILHVGWKDVGERVRRGVEEVFEGCVHRSCNPCTWQLTMFQRISEDQAHRRGRSQTDMRRPSTGGI